jgi:hypothetical protein
MPPDQAAENNFDQLREKAEALIREHPDQNSGALPSMLELIHELRIHQGVTPTFMSPAAIQII